MIDMQIDYFRLLILPLLLPLGIGIFILANYWRDEVSRYIGFLSLKPVIAYPIWFVLSWTNWFNTDWLNNFYDPNPVSFALVPLIPGITLTLIIVYSFRHLFGTDRLVWLFLLGDVVRWMNTFIFSAFPESNIVFNIFIFLVLFGLWFPSIYAIIALFAVRKRNTKHQELV